MCLTRAMNTLKQFLDAELSSKMVAGNLGKKDITSLHRTFKVS